jgi:hypothetical protein
MADRSFSEVDVRRMLEDAKSYEADIESGRWVIHTVHDRCPWHIIVEPDSSLNLLVIVTAYPID